MYGFVELGISNSPYTVSLWVRPSSQTGSTLIRVSTTRTGSGWCNDLLGFSSTGQIIMTGFGTLVRHLIGPVIPMNVWTHIVGSYSLFNGNRLYINGTFVGGTGLMNYSGSGQVNFITLGNPLQGVASSSGRACTQQPIVPNAYSGSIDEFRLYSRELIPSEISLLANP